MAQSGSLPPTEGIIQKQGGGRSFFGSKDWASRYVRIEDGILRYWKSKDDAVRGIDSLKKVGIPLDDYHLVPDTDAKDGFWQFQVKQKPGKSLDQKLRESYQFRVHAKEDMEGWCAVFRAWGCHEADRADADTNQLRTEALKAAAPPEMLQAAEILQNSSEPAAAPAPAPAPAATPAPAPAPAPEPAPAPAPEPAAKEEEEKEEPAAEEEVEENKDEAGGDDENEVNDQWTAYVDEEGDVFYVNNESGESQWEAPEGFTGTPIPHSEDE